MNQAKPIMCPSAQPGMVEPRVIGVITEEQGESRIAYLNEVVPVTGAVLAMAAPAEPSQIFRIAAHCEEQRCTHFDGSHCQLATRIVQILPAVVDELPICVIRATCRWYVQEGKPACFRCPQVVTQPNNPTAEFVEAATPAHAGD